MYVAFRFGAKKQTNKQTKQNKKTFKKTFRGKKKKHLEATNRVAGVNLLCSPQNKIFGNKFLRPQLTLLSHGFGYTPGTTQSPFPLGQNLDNEFLREHLLSSQKFVYRQLKPFLSQFSLLMHPFMLRSSFVPRLLRVLSGGFLKTGLAK